MCMESVQNMMLVDKEEIVKRNMEELKSVGEAVDERLCSSLGALLDERIGTANEKGEHAPR